MLNPAITVDYRLAFELAPIGLVLSRHRSIIDCNTRLCEMFGQSREVLIGQTFQVLYPSQQEYERTGSRIAPILNAGGHYADDRVMKRGSGETFWCHVTGRAMNRQNLHEPPGRSQGESRSAQHAGYSGQPPGRSQGESRSALHAGYSSEASIWTFMDLSSRRPVKAELTAREREVAAHLLDGLTSKEIGRALAISHRTVEVYRARLMRKYTASTTADLVHKLIAG